MWLRLYQCLLVLTLAWVPWAGRAIAQQDQVPLDAIDLDATLSLDRFITQLATKRVVFVGETHYRYDHHLKQLEIIRRLHQMDPNLAIGVEYFQQPFQPQLDDYITGRTYFRHGLSRQFRQWHSRCCPRVLGIDEHYFTRKKGGYATTLCDLGNHNVYDVVLGRSEASLERYFLSLEGKDWVRMVCMDLASVYRALVRKHFPQARIVADRFHMIGIINITSWPAGARSTGWARATAASCR